ncbi:MAG: hypothetical protein ACLQBL_28620 [Polyangiaceae bacterium]
MRGKSTTSAVDPWEVLARLEVRDSLEKVFPLAASVLYPDSSPLTEADELLLHIIATLRVLSLEKRLSADMASAVPRLKRALAALTETETRPAQIAKALAIVRVYVGRSSFDGVSVEYRDLRDALQGQNLGFEGLKPTVARDIINRALRGDSSKTGGPTNVREMWVLAKLNLSCGALGCPHCLGATRPANRRSLGSSPGDAEAKPPAGNGTRLIRTALPLAA